MKKYKMESLWLLSLMVILGGLSSIALGSMAFLSKVLIDYDFERGISRVVLIVVFYLVSSSLNLLFEYASQRMSWKFRKKLTLSLKKDLFKAIFSWSYERFSGEEIGTYLSVFSNDLESAKNYIEQHAEVVKYLIQLIVFTTFLVKLDFRIAIVIALFSSLAAFLPSITNPKLSRYKKNHLKSQASYSNVLKDLLSGFKLISVSPKDKFDKVHYEEADCCEKSLMKFSIFKSFSLMVNAGFMYLLNCTAFAMIALLLYKKQITLGSATATLYFMENYVFYIRYLLEGYNNLKASKAGADRLLYYLEQDDTHKKEDAFESCIELEAVEYHVEDFRLSELNLVFEKNKKYAIIGESGSGKSTLLNLIAGHLQPSSGQIRIDQESLRWQRPNVPLLKVDQFEHVFSCGFFDNVTLFDTYDKDDLVGILDTLCMDKLKRLVSQENVSGASGGERQLIALVRAMLIDARVLLLDEPFASLDIHHASKMRAWLRCQNKTVITVTHDLTYDNLSDYDEIIMMKSGKVEFTLKTNDYFGSDEYLSKSKKLGGLSA
ncbi:MULTISPECIES: ABC transporter ATP-binding protein [unclassified Fusibacter]|uniref:ATP-binding cassette domain-containing protein n=1 Tax=unclassified Fusibacter TaxID=2624464 RepID=UPI0013E95CF2|nr:MULTISPECIES: ABC transporter ATP-binding protein [unclassified Fusibacter]MCK8059703.1 ABC transporter ATP-binding protein/permease [Fusibacter sp. A2]NPE21504.1 ABC transporter ATP-binding protein [Fusibacter sp. A1]